MQAKVSAKAERMITSPPTTSLKKALSRPPMIAPPPEASPLRSENTATTHSSGTMPRQYMFIMSMLSMFLLRTMPP